MEMHFRIVTPVYNAEKWIGDCIKSVREQTEQNWSQIVVVDGATDNTYNEAVLASGEDPRITIIKLDKRMGACSSHKLAHDLHTKNQDDIFIHLDGDDKLLHENVLNYVKTVYLTYNVWATYGDYVTESGRRSVCRRVNLQEGIRSQILVGWPFSHLRTFKCFLWDKLNQNDLLDSNGNSFASAADVAIFAPILEMCGNKIAYIPEPLYFYNDNNPLNDDKCRLQDQVRCAIEIYNKNRKSPL